MNTKNLDTISSLKKDNHENPESNVNILIIIS
jgi:hypothetical protein